MKTPGSFMKSTHFGKSTKNVAHLSHYGKKWEINSVPIYEQKSTEVNVTRFPAYRSSAQSPIQAILF